ncbi:transmembrane and coiled-coil domain-containing protein 4-like [Diadema setosum]|uniref:transmembrane and coiled-coil domain-containing protein 4-like n=1 Tax=Diadema setosum TaxID=31175 RepID=UPI003B3B38E1
MEKLEANSDGPKWHPLMAAAADDDSEASSSGIFSQEETATSPASGASGGDDDYQAHLQQRMEKYIMEDADEQDSRTAGPAQTAGSKANTGQTDVPKENSEKGGEPDMKKTHSADRNAMPLAEDQPKEPLNESLSDVAKFAYSSLIAVCLPNLFENQCNKQWNLKMVKELSKYLKLPKQSQQTLNIMVEDPYHHDMSNADVFTECLVEDPSLLRPDIIPKDMITRALHNGTYDARMRVLVKEVARRLKVPWETIRAFERGIIDMYEQEEHQLSEEERREKEKKAKIRKAKRVLMIGAATIGGGAIIGLTGGLAAPLIASAGAALLGTSIGFFGTVAGAAVIGSIIGAAGAGLSGYKMNKRVGAVEEFEFMPLNEGKDLHVTIAVSGWLTKDRLDNFSAPWYSLASCQEIYCLKWESKYLLDLGQAMEYILDSVMTMAAKEALKYTVLSGLLAAIALPAFAYTAISSSIDNPWSVATSRAGEAGKQLAEVILSRQQGKRPVTLIGFSMGARVIFFCLQELAQRSGCEGIVQDVYLLGAPVTSVPQRWQPFAKVVAGKIVNGFCRGDWLLQFVYRTASMQVSDIAGLEPIRWDNRRMVNVDLTDVVNGHLDYSDKMATILEQCGLETRELPRSSSDLSKLRDTREKKDPARAGPTPPKDAGDEEGGRGDITIDAMDLLIPKSASAMNLALTKQTEEGSVTADQGSASHHAKEGSSDRPGHVHEVHAGQSSAENSPGVNTEGAKGGDVLSRSKSVEVGEDPLQALTEDKT